MPEASSGAVIAAQPRWLAMLRPLRVHQRVKNLLVFVPLMPDYRLFRQDLLLHAVLAFAAFSCAASGGYILSDLLDLDADRGFPLKEMPRG